MIVYRGEFRGQDLKTMSVGELKAKLAEYPDDLPVFITWEGQQKEIYDSRFDVEDKVWVPWSSRMLDIKALIIDAE